MTDTKIEEEIGNVPFSNVGVAVKDGIVASLKGLNEIETEMVNVARTAVSGTLGATGDIANEGFNVATSVSKRALQATEEVGADLLKGTTSVAKGIIMGVSDVEHVAETAVIGAIEGAGNIGKTATRSVTDILVGVAGGAKEVLGAILPQSSRRIGEEAKSKEPA